MLVRLAATAVLAASAVSAFRNASPFFLFTTSRLPILQTGSEPGEHIAEAATIETFVHQSLSHCPSDTYLLVDQPGVSTADFSRQSTTPHLRRRLTGLDKGIKTTRVVSNVVGNVALGRLENALSKQCSAPVVSLSEPVLPNLRSTPQIISVAFSNLPTKAGDRIYALDQHDSYLNELIMSLPNQNYTVIYTTSTPDSEFYEQYEHPEQLYEMDEPYPSGMHVELRRDLTAYQNASNSSNLDYDLPLFEKYQFLSSGIFMGVTVSLLLLTILYVGISAISGLEVSYMAFSKEMNPSAQKKQQ